MNWSKNCKLLAPNKKHIHHCAMSNTCTIHMIRVCICYRMQCAHTHISTSEKIPFAHHMHTRKYFKHMRASTCVCALVCAVCVVAVELQTPTAGWVKMYAMCDVILRVPCSTRMCQLIYYILFGYRNHTHKHKHTVNKIVFTEHCKNFTVLHIQISPSGDQSISSEISFNPAYSSVFQLWKYLPTYSNLLLHVEYTNVTNWNCIMNMKKRS